MYDAPRSERNESGVSGFSVAVVCAGVIILDALFFPIQVSVSGCSELFHVCGE